MNSIMSLEGADYWECGVSVKCERLTEKPGLEQHESSSACAAEEEAGGQTECGVSVKCSPVKEEPGLEQHESNSACAADEGAGGQTECGVSAAAARAGLYAGHEIKGELVLGPTALQPPDSAFEPAVSMRNEEHIGLLPAEESGPSPARGPRRGARSPQLHPPQIHSRRKQHKGGKKLFKCEYCMKCFSEKGTLVSHERKHTAEELYECDTCSAQFARVASLAEHVLGHTACPPCALCGACFERREQLLQHAMAHIWTPEHPRVNTTVAELTGSPRAGQWGPLRACSVRVERLPADGRASSAILSKSFQRQTNQETKPQDAPAVRLYACDACGEQFALKRSLIRHIPLHSSDLHAQANTGRAPDIVSDETGSGPPALFTAIRRQSAGLIQTSQGDAGDEPLQCKLCMKLFSCKSKLVEHERMHTGEKPHKCKICLKQFTRKLHLVNHVRIHTGEKPFKCKICLKLFTSGYSLSEHKRIHTGEKPFKCEICLKQFTQSSTLAQHLRIHSEEKPYECGICLKQFARKVHLDIHVRIHTGEKPYKCKICLKQFTSGDSLTRHKRIHTGEKPFKCEICLKQFTQSGSLSLHLRIHTGKKPYKCEICSRQFSVRQYLKIHKRIHSRDSVYECDMCRRQFVTKSSLVAHIRGHEAPSAAGPVRTPACPEVSSTVAELTGSPRAEQRGRLRACSVRVERLPADGRASSAILSTSVQSQTNQGTKTQGAPAVRLYGCTLAGNSSRMIAHKIIHTGMNE